MNLHEALVGPWTAIVRTALIGVLAYGSLVLLLRVSGKRSLSKLNAFDLVVTVALGSTLATMLLSKDTALLQGLTALVVLVLLQFVVAWTNVRSRRMRLLVNAVPTLVLYRGELLHESLRRERLTVEEVYAALRQAGLEHADEAAAVVIESDGSLSVVHAEGTARPPQTLQGVRTRDEDTRTSAPPA